MKARSWLKKNAEHLLLITEIKALAKMEKRECKTDREICGVLNKFANTRGHHCCCPSIGWLSHNEQRVPRRSRFLPRKDPSFFFLLSPHLFSSLRRKEVMWRGHRDSHQFPQYGCSGDSSAAYKNVPPPSYSLTRSN